MNQEKLAALNQLFQSEIEANRLQGASILVERKGKLEFSNVYGGDKENSIYKIYSMTKPITTVAVMQLYEKGLIDLYDPVDMYLPGFAHMKVSTPEGLVDAKSKITIKQLMCMTSGLVYPGEMSEPEKAMAEIQVDLHTRAVNGEPFTNLDICNELAKAPLLFQPGEGWKYGISADIAAAVVEVVTGVPYGEHLKKAIFEPLEMKDTGFYVQPDQMHRLATMYSRMDEEGHLRKANEEELEWLNLYAPDRPPYIESGGGGLYSTMEDYRHFVQMLMNKGEYKGKRILGRKTIEYMAMNQLDELQMSWVDFDSIVGYGYSNFMRIMLHPEMAGSNGSVGEYGWDGLPGTYFMVDPKEDLMMVYMQQIQQGADLKLRRKMRQIIYGAIED